MTNNTSAWFRVRLGILYLGFATFLGLVCFRLVQLQVLDNPQLEALANRQFQQKSKKKVFRLGLLDRNAEELAVTIPSGSVFARPKLVSKKREASRKLAKWLGGDSRVWYDKLRSHKPYS
jgi:cell division protein FtsI/penicillin-binding protein 2